MTLIDELRTCVGAENVLTGGDCASYRSDWTGTYVADPVAVVRPGSTKEVSAVVKLCAAEKTPIVPVSGNTSLNGGTFAKDAVMISLERMNRIREIRPDARIAVVDAGVILSSLHDAADAHDLVFPLTFGARGSAMIGGVLSTNAGGSNVLRYGNTRALCLGLEVVLPDGQVMDLMSALHKDNSGYDLKDLIIGAEGTLGLITGAVMKLSPKPLAYATAMVAVPRLDQALSLLNRLQTATGGAVEAFEFMPRKYIETHVEMFEKARQPFEEMHDVNILLEVGATAPRDATPGEDGAVPIVSYLETVLGEMMEQGDVIDAVVARSEAQRAEMWERREAAAEVCLTHKPLQNNDIAVPLDRVAPFIEEMEKRLEGIDPDAVPMIVSHLGDGNVHYALIPSSDDPALHDRLMETVEDVTLELGGSFSAEHGIGLSKKPSMARRKDPVALGVMRSIKAALDPDGIMNPGKVLPGN
ncbi:MAG: FAD-binding oxidoreductase [Paracoccaceae bacterium]